MKPRGRPSIVAKNAHPLAKRLFALMRKQGVTSVELERRSGVAKAAIKSWAKGRIGYFHNLEACFNALGFTLELRELPK